MPDLPDAELLARFRRGDERALDRLIDRYEAPVFQFLTGLLRDHHQAEDALQETFVRALARLDAVDPEHLRGWLFTVAYHQAMLLKRKARRAETQPLGNEAATPEPGPLSRAAQQDDARRLNELLARLPSSQREVIHQRVYEGKRFREIAAALGCPLNTALARMHQGLKRLRLLWEQDHARTERLGRPG